MKSSVSTKVPRLISTSLLVGILLFQLLTCFFVVLNNTPVYIGISGGLLVLSTIGFIIIYKNRSFIEKQIKQGVSSERMEEEGLITHEELEQYQHPLENEALRVSVD